MRNILMAVLFFCAGCAASNTIEYTSDASGRWIKTVYSKSYLSPQVDLGNGLIVTITGLDEGKVNPFAEAIGALGPETTTPPASYVLHFRNTSQQPVDLELVSLKVMDVAYSLEPKTVTVQPGEIVDSSKVMARLSVWSHDIQAELSVKDKGQMIVRNIVLSQETQNEFKARKKRDQESLKK